MNWFGDPADPGVAANSLMLRIHQDNLEVLVGRVLIDPVRVQYTQITTALAYTLFRSGPERALVLELVDTVVGGFA